MHIIAHFDNNNSLKLSLTGSQIDRPPIDESITAKYQYPNLFRSQIVTSRFTETKYDRIHKDRVQQSDQILVNNSRQSCRNCDNWKKWAQEQEKGMLELERQLIGKEQKLEVYAKKQKNEILVKSQKIEELEMIIVMHKGKITKLELQILQLTKKCQDLSLPKLNYETPRKQIKNAQLEIDFSDNKPDKLAHIRQISGNLQTMVKTSAITTKAQDWQYGDTLKKEIREKDISFNKKAGVQKCLFQNQMLKDYNSVLLERLKASKYKRVAC